MDEQPKYDELGLEDSFNFTCGEGQPCFVDCCTGTRIWLYPYDVVRIRRALGISSGEFLRRYTWFLDPGPPGYPVLLLKSANRGEGRCPFAEDSGCTIYPDRPWICRLFPVIPVECRTDITSEADRRFNILEWEGCRGVGRGPAVTIREWWQRSGMSVYEEAYPDWQQLTEALKSSSLLPLSSEATEQFILGSYDPDLFREKLLTGEVRETLSLDKSELTRALIDDVFLLKIACRWMCRALLGG